MLSDFDLEGMSRPQKAVYYLKNYGIGYTARKAMIKLGIPLSKETEYMNWCRKQMCSKKELKEQEKANLSEKYSFTVILEKNKQNNESDWKKQSCQRVSILTLDSSTDMETLLTKAKGDFLVFCGESVSVCPEFLFEVSRVAQDAEVIYTDEDNCVRHKRVRPFFKPDASPQLLLNFQYMGKVIVIKRTLLEKICKESHRRIRLFGDGWYDIALNCFRYTDAIRHIPKVLFSNLVEKSSKLEFVRCRDTNQKDDIIRYLRDENLAGKVVASDVEGFYHVQYELEKEPLVSIIIPNKDHTKDLQLCLDSLREKSDYTNYEIIIAENNSEEAETFAYYDRIQREDDRIHVVVWKGIFNYSAINNFALSYAKGDLFLFLNNDTEFMESNTLRELVCSVVKDGVGAAGAMLYYGDGTIQHAGVILGMGGFAAHALWSLTDRDETYYPFSLCEREVSAVTGACLMVRREVCEEVGGMGEEFVVALNDIDFCMKIRKAGYKILFNPYAKLYHYESKSRGYEDTVEKQARFQKEIDAFQTKWQKEIEAGDPYYNRNLTLHRADYSMDYL